MKDLPGMRDQDIDHLLSTGGAGAGSEGEGLDELAAFVQGVRAAYAVAPTPEVQARHIAAAVAVARAQPGGAEVPLLAPASAEGRSRRIAKWRRRTVFGWSFASVTTMLTAAAVAATAATGGLAATGKLPDPIQEVVAQAVSNVGISLPSPEKPSGSPAGHSSNGAPTRHRSEPTPQAGAASPSRTTPPASPSPHAHRYGSGDDRLKTTPAAEGPRSGRGSATPSHGNCVSYASSISEGLGLTDGGRDTFVSLVDHDQSAVTVRVAEGAKPDAACHTAIDKARAAASAGTGRDRSHGSGSPRSPEPPPTAPPAPTLTPSPERHGGH